MKSVTLRIKRPIDRMLPRRDPFNSVNCRVKGSNAHFNSGAHEEKPSNASTAPRLILYETVFMETQMP